MYSHIGAGKTGKVYLDLGNKYNALLHSNTKEGKSLANWVGKKLGKFKDGITGEDVIDVIRTDVYANTMGWKLSNTFRNLYR